jgi:malate dehydrogenase (oxaloacetate-decarboxylating)(NADP+)
MYTGMKEGRAKHKSDAGTDVNSCYFGDSSFIGEFMGAASELFGPSCVLQFEDFNSNDAFPLLAEYRTKHLSYNDDIQGTASVAVAAVLGAIKIMKPESTDLIGPLRNLKVLFHGAGSANLGAASLLIQEAKVPASQVVCTNSKGVIWQSADGKEGTFRNHEQQAVAQVGKPEGYDPKDLVAIIEHFKPNVLIGAVGVAPNCFSKAVIEAMVKVQAGGRPIIFALSNPKTQAEITAKDCYAYSGGSAIFGSGTRFPECEVNGKMREPGQVNNVSLTASSSSMLTVTPSTAAPPTAGA